MLLFTSEHLVGLLYLSCTLIQKQTKNLKVVTDKRKIHLIICFSALKGDNLSCHAARVNTV